MKKNGKLTNLQLLPKKVWYLPSYQINLSKLFTRSRKFIHNLYIKLPVNIYMINVRSQWKESKANDRCLQRLFPREDFLNSYHFLWIPFIFGRTTLEIFKLMLNNQCEKFKLQSALKARNKVLSGLIWRLI